jgi:hypothetical protein
VCARPFITTRETTTENETITIPVDSQDYNFQINWGDEGAARNLEMYKASNPVVSHTFATP